MLGERPARLEVRTPYDSGVRWRAVSRFMLNVTARAASCDAASVRRMQAVSTHT